MYFFPPSLHEPFFCSVGNLVSWRKGPVWWIENTTFFRRPLLSAYSHYHWGLIFPHPWTHFSGFLILYHFHFSTLDWAAYPLNKEKWQIDVEERIKCSLAWLYCLVFGELLFCVLELESIVNWMWKNEELIHLSEAYLYSFQKRNNFYML